ncbi:hypothetical protein ABG752_01680 [Streptococcus iniae]
MKILRFTLLGNPSIHLDNQEIFFSFAKINALLYYMVINGNVNRDEIAGILWEDKDTKTAKKTYVIPFTRLINYWEMTTS